MRPWAGMSWKLVLLAALVLDIIVPRSEAAVDRNGAFIGYSEKSGSVCVDKDGDKCVDWAANGECEKNPGFMKLKCTKSCDACNELPSDNPKLKPLPAGFSRDTVVFSTSQGDIRILLRPDISPKTAAYVLSVAKGGGCGPECRFYRSEKLPKPGAIDNFGGPGPPYALLQGSLAGASFKPLEKEGAPAAGRGFACLIGNGPDFFLAVGQHVEWGNAHTVWGEVEPASMEVVDKIVNELPVKEEVWGETHVTTLITPLPYSLSLASASGDR